jgi:hypothetical protein
LIPEEVKLLVMPFPKVAVIEFVSLVNESVEAFKTQVKVFVATEAVSELEATKRIE